MIDRKKRDRLIRREAKMGRHQKELAIHYNLSEGRISQIVNERSGIFYIMWRWLKGLLNHRG